MTARVLLCFAPTGGLMIRVGAEALSAVARLNCRRCKDVGGRCPEPFFRRLLTFV